MYRSVYKNISSRSKYIFLIQNCTLDHDRENYFSAINYNLICYKRTTLFFTSVKKIIKQQNGNKIMIIEELKI